MQRSEEQRTLYLLDGSAYTHRAYYAIRSLANSRGFPTNVVFGFTRMILKFLEVKRPEYLSVVFDAKGPTFRHEMYPEYKANRAPMPDDMAVQLPIVKEIVEKMGLNLLEMEGFEADDLIGSLARLAEGEGFLVIIVTCDKDFRQVVTRRTSLWDPVKDSVVDYDTLRAKYGFEPEKFVDVMALSGDSSDNIPGVPGIGEKIGSDLIRSYGSLEAVLEHASELTRKKLKKNLQEYRHLALLSRELVKFHDHVPLDGCINRLAVGTPEGEGLADIFREMELRNLRNLFAP